MPQVPTYGSERVREAALPAPRLSTDLPVEAFGGGPAAEGVTRAGGQLVSDISALVLEEKKKANGAVNLETDGKLSKLETDLLYAPPTLPDGKPNPKRGALTVMGKNALALPDEVRDSWEKAGSEIEKGLSNEDQKLYFRKFHSARWFEIDRQVQRHVSQQIQKHDEESMNSYMANEQAAAAFNFGDSSRIGLAIVLQKGKLQEFAERNGKPPEWLEEQQREAESRTNIGVINRMIATDNYDAARQYFKANKKGISGLEADDVERKIKETDQVRMKDTYLAAGSALDKKQNANPANLPGYERMSPEQRAALKRRYSGAPNSPTAQFDLNALSDKELAQLDRADFETKYWSYLDAPHRVEADARWNAAVKAFSGGGAKGDEFKDLRSSTDMIVSSMRKAKFIPFGQLSDADKELVSTVEDRVNDDRLVFFRRNKGNPNDEEMRKIINRNLIDVRLRQTFSDPRVPLGTLTPEQEAAAYKPIADIPAHSKQRIINLLRAAGQITHDVSDDRAASLARKQIESIYAASLRNASDEEIERMISGGQ